MRAGGRVGGGLLKCSEVLFLKPGGAIVTFASPLFPTVLSAFFFLLTLSSLAFFFLIKTPQDKSLIDSWKCEVT